MRPTLHFAISFSLVLLVAGASAQNVVPNPSFDVQTGCPQPSEIELAPPWYAPTAGTPDLFNTTCPSQNGPGHSGIGSAGVFVHGEGAFANYREYVQAQLTSPLQAGQGYCASVWVKRANFKYATDRFGILLSTTPVSLTGTNVLFYTPQVQNPPGNVLSETGWILISGGFYSEGGEQYITIGSFSGPENTTIDTVNAGSTSNVAFYSFDDVMVVPCAVGINERIYATFEVYPQPAVGNVTVRLPEGARPQGIRLFDGRGSLVQSFTERASTSTLDLDLSGIGGGLYYLVIDTDQGRLSQTVIIGE